jgi:hypothetical protein
LRAKISSAKGGWEVKVPVKVSFDRDYQNAKITFARIVPATFDEAVDLYLEWYFEVVMMKHWRTYFLDDVFYMDATEAMS